MKSMKKKHKAYWSFPFLFNLLVLPDIPSPPMLPLPNPTHNHHSTAASSYQKIPATYPTPEKFSTMSSRSPKQSFGMEPSYIHSKYLHAS